MYNNMQRNKPIVRPIWIFRKLNKIKKKRTEYYNYIFEGWFLNHLKLDPKFYTKKNILIHDFKYNQTEEFIEETF